MLFPLFTRVLSAEAVDCRFERIARASEWGKVRLSGGLGERRPTSGALPLSYIDPTQELFIF